DILVQGAKPLFFLDYLAMGTLNNKTAEIVIDGIAEGCIQANCALIGGETAEMPGMYQENEYDLSGFSVGLVDNEKMIDGSNIQNGYKLIGLASSGVHSNGFSLVRKVFFEKCGYNVNTKISELGTTLGEELLKPTKIYVSSILSLLRDLPIHGMAHITGGGIEENIIRSIPQACKAVIKKGSWDNLPIFDIIKKQGSISDEEMNRTFNNGIGMILVVPSNFVQDILDRLLVMKETAFIIGDVVSRTGSEKQTQWV
ncbi:MAG: phosphoribosylformylglycinamidine cyclo-ligase, partial [Desulfobacteraceae bacterium]|nr:phosphoribosylformylglycinamidine cyclo-ligase [Desulfobacteraceae bacterium]